MKYLCFDVQQLAFKTTGSGVASEYGDTGINAIFYEISDEKIKTYADLKSEFLEYCTDEFADKLLTDTSHMYKDIDGKLYATETMFCYRGYQDTYITDW